ncbi:MAG: ABC transporter substrate-binding protein [Chlamydiae bacterium]|nr:ABC transporter substrate-binding protein [Chlamydiota bacterium]MBI3266091.1 ABC transporter substrate-binding protein [Chlamydiota bacterium]
MRLKNKSWKLEVGSWMQKPRTFFSFLPLTFNLQPPTFFLISLCILFLHGCSRPIDDSKTLNLYFDADPITLDPALITDVRSGKLAALLYDTLLQYDEKLTLISSLAKSWKISKDGKVYTFLLRSDVPFSNGRFLKARDVRFSLERLASPSNQSPRAWILSHVQGFQEFQEKKNKHICGIRILNSHKIKIVLQRPFSPFLSMLTMPNASIISRQSGQAFIGSGPFRLAHWRHDYEMVLKKNPNYFQGAPEIKQICFRIIKETLFVSSEFRRGHLDMIEVPGPELSLYLKDPQWENHLVFQENPNLYYLGFNCRQEALQKSEIRKAIATAIDLPLLLETLKKNKASRINGPIPSLLEDPSPLQPLSYHPDLAREILIQNHFNFDRPLTLLQSSNEETLELSEALQFMLQAIGVQVKIVEKEWSSFKSSLNQGDFDLFLISWWADYPDGENFLYPLFHSSNWPSGGNYTGFSNLEIDSLIEKLQNSSSSNEQRKISDTIQEKILDESPLVPLYSSRTCLLEQPWIKGYTPHPLYNGNKYLHISKEISSP